MVTSDPTSQLCITHSLMSCREGHNEGNFYTFSKSETDNKTSHCTKKERERSTNQPLTEFAAKSPQRYFAGWSDYRQHKFSNSAAGQRPGPITEYSSPHPFSLLDWRQNNIQIFIAHLCRADYTLAIQIWPAHRPFLQMRLFGWDALLSGTDNKATQSNLEEQSTHLAKVTGCVCSCPASIGTMAP